MALKSVVGVHDDIPLHTMRKTITEKIITNVDKGVGKLEASYIADGKVKWCDPFEKTVR